MPIARVHSFLVHPGKGENIQREIGGTTLPSSGQLFEMLRKIYDRAPSECDIEILFRPNDSGAQQNERLDDFVAYVKDPNVRNGRRIAERLQAVTTNRSRLGLLFLMTGTENGLKRLVVSRFPADQGIIAEEDEKDLSVEFLERVFMKNARAYKSAFYEAKSPAKGYWSGRAIDRQISGGTKEISDYWIREFLMSDLRVTGPAGTRRIAVGIRDAVRNADSLEVRQELIAAATLVRSNDGKVVTGKSIVSGLGLSSDATNALEDALPGPDLMDESFRFERAEFDRHVLFRMVELDNGAVLLAEMDRFDEVFERHAVDADAGIERFSTQGTVEDVRVRRSR